MSIVPIWNGGWDHEAEKILVRYRSFSDLIHQLDLPAAIHRDPLINVSKTQ